jgi:hypothetical protein
MTVVDLCGLVTIALSLLCVWLITQIMPRPGQTRSTLLDEAQGLHDTQRDLHTAPISASSPADRSASEVPIATGGR